MFEVWFWQLIISPHMADLAVALARRGCKVNYVVHKEMSKDRAQQGWQSPSLQGVNLHVASSNVAVQHLIQAASDESVHICQGIRANGMVGLAQRALKTRGLRQWVIMETVNDAGWRGLLKRVEYCRVLRRFDTSLQGILATGHSTRDWISARGISPKKIYPFAYFLPDGRPATTQIQRESGPFRFVFAGRLIPLKRVDWLINSLATLQNKSFELWIVGTGSAKTELESLAFKKLGNRVRWLGQLTMPEVPVVMAQADCLVLPSEHDGWGAVASESLIVGTPVVCSDACGVAGVVRNSGYGGVFATNNFDEFTSLLAKQIAQGEIHTTQRQKVARWSTCLNSDSGARYLHEILEFSLSDEKIRPVEPWCKPVIN